MLGIKDVDLKILSELDDKDLLSFCITSKYGKTLCENEDFWRNRFVSKFSPSKEAFKFKPYNLTWKKYYLKTVIDVEEMAKFGSIGYQTTPNERRMTKDGLYILNVIADNYLNKLNISSRSTSSEMSFQVKNPLIFSNYLFNRVSVEGFKALRYFMQHPEEKPLTFKKVEDKFYLKDAKTVYISGVVDYILFEILETIRKDIINSEDILNAIRLNRNFNKLL